MIKETKKQLEALVLKVLCLTIGSKHIDFTVDNRRLFAAREANSKVNSVWATKENLGNNNLNRRCSTEAANRTIKIRCP